MILICFVFLAEIRSVILITDAGDCHDWDDEMWQKISAYCSKLAVQRVKKKERKLILLLFFLSFSGFPFVCPSHYVSGPLPR